MDQVFPSLILYMVPTCAFHMDGPNERGEGSESKLLSRHRGQTKQVKWTISSMADESGVRLVCRDVEPFQFM